LHCPAVHHHHWRVHEQLAGQHAAEPGRGHNQAPATREAHLQRIKAGAAMHVVYARCLQDRHCSGREGKPYCGHLCGSMFRMSSVL
jgi:hypothetical protein